MVVERKKRGLRVESWGMFELKAREKIEEPKSEKEMVLSEKVVVGGTGKTVSSQICRAWIKSRSSQSSQTLGTWENIVLSGLKILEF